MTHIYAEKFSLKKEDIYYCNLPSRERAEKLFALFPAL